MTDIKEESMDLHRKIKGKITIEAKAKIENKHDLALLYTPGVAEACMQIFKNPELVYDLTMKHNTVAIVSDGTRVLGLGKIGAEAALPVMEGKALIMKEFGGIDAFPICLKTTDADTIVEIVKNLEPNFGAINLEDIETPKVFEIEQRLIEEMNIPVFHDDQHGTAMVVLAALINALKIAKKGKDAKILMVGAGAAGYAISHLLPVAGYENLVVFDREGAIEKSRPNLEPYKIKLAELTNKEGYKGKLEDYKGADVMICASSPKSVPHITINNMRGPKILFSLANPVPEISLDEAKILSVEIYGSGRADVPNQINNSVCFPGFLRALLDFRIKKIAPEMKIAAAQAIADVVSEEELKTGKIIPDTFDKRILPKILEYVKKVV
ncbi:MAG: malic enzyme-like NAD(P)-binding protein [Candidatus Micrarchaeota archaeon]